MSTDFSSMGIIPALTERLHLDGIIEPTPVQQKAIPVLMAGQDVIAQAQTGTGKTIAFALPILQRIDVSKDQVQALILTPTRELAIQITSELAKLAPVVGAKVLAAYGGQDVTAQIRKLNNAPQIVVATPGRLIDHMKRETINLGKLKMLVLDEADQMLHMGFLSEVESIIVQTPKSRQTMLFSATMPDAIKRLAENYMKVPVDIRIKSPRITLDNIKQYVVEVTDRGREKALIQIIENQNPYLAVIFCRTKVRAKKLNQALQDHGFASDELHGDLTQAKREQVMKRFRDAKLQILVATDVAARGLDVEGVTHVFNYDVPQDSEIYIHRIGRTGRAGQKGAAVTFVSPYDRGAIQHIERNIDAVLERRTMEADGTMKVDRSPRQAVKISSKDDNKQERGARRGRDSKPGQGGRSGGRTERAGGRGGERKGPRAQIGTYKKQEDTRSAGGNREGNLWEDAGSAERGGRDTRNAGGAGRGGKSSGGYGANRGGRDARAGAPERGGRDARNAGAPERGGRDARNAGAPERGGRDARNTAGTGRGGRDNRNASAPETPASWGNNANASSTSNERGSKGGGGYGGNRGGSGRTGGAGRGKGGSRHAGPSGNRGGGRRK